MPAERIRSCASSNRWPHAATRATRLRATTDRYREFLEALGVAVYTTDADGKITFFNEAAAELWGRRPELGEEWCGSFRLFWSDGSPLAHGDCPMAIALKEGRAVRGFTAIAERPDGSRVDFQPYPTPLYDRDRRLIGAVNVLVDVTERRRSGGRAAVDRRGAGPVQQREGRVRRVDLP